MLLRSFIKNSVQCRLCRRISAYVMLSILVVEAAILVPSYRNYERDLLDRLDNVGRTEILTLFRSNAQAAPDELLAKSEALIRSGSVRGGTLYAKNGAWQGEFGEIPEIISGVHESGTRSDDGRHYDVFWSAASLGTDYGIAVQLNTS